jgi:prephenate dehydrogenase
MSASSSPIAPAPAAPHFEHAVIIGYGVIGASVALALHQREMASRVSAWDKNAESLAVGVAEGVLHCGGRSEDALAMMLADADLVIFALPPQLILDVAQQVGKMIPEAALVMDVASIKQPIADGLRSMLAYPHRYIPAHPIAGSAGSGAAFAKADLFEHRSVMLSPEMGVEINDPALLAARGMWEGLGAEVTLMPANVHDGIYAYVSHLPQAIAFAAGHALLSRFSRADIVKGAPKLVQDSNAAPGELMTRFLRLNASSPALWTEIFTLNAASVTSALATAISYAKHFQKELAEGHEKNATTEAPSDVPADEIAYLFARIMASCLVMTVYQLEHNAKMKVARFAGSGFADVAAPAIESPEPEYERISAAWQPILSLLNASIASLEEMLQQLQMQQTALLEGTLERLRV